MINCYSVSVFGYVERSNYKSNQCFLIALMKRIMEIKEKNMFILNVYAMDFVMGNL